VRTEISDEVSSTLHSVLNGTKTGCDGAWWTATLERWITDGVTQERSDEDTQELKRRAEQEIRRSNRSFARAERFRKRGALFAGIVLVGGLVLAVPATVIRNALRPPLTAGLEPAALVESFYYSTNTLDHEFIDDALANNTARNLVREVVSLYVIERERQGRTLQAAGTGEEALGTGLVDARVWLEAGMPLGGIGYPYGVTNLETEQLPSDDEDVVIRAVYQRWSPQYPDHDAEVSETGIEGRTITEELRLRAGRRSWEIYSISRISETPIDIEELRSNL
jgi:hypothetical protein